MPTFAFEQRILSVHPGAVVAGVDEAGRGPWAGPVVAAAAVLNDAELPDILRHGLDDSKRLSYVKRKQLFDVLNATQAVRIGVGQASVEEIDAHNILQATYMAMQRGIAALGCSVDVALVDGNRAPPLPCHVQTLVKGDRLSLSIAAASIVAKVTRDRFMTDLAARFPGYGWATNMGYGTAEHQSALQKLGVTAHHRRSFAPVRALLEKTENNFGGL
jgi:ribonuclease HII